MPKKRLFDRIKGSFEQAIAGGGRITTITMPDPAPQYTPQQVQAIRSKLQMTQNEFAILLNVSVKTVESWEQGVKPPSGGNLRLLQFVDDPDAITLVVKERCVAAGR